MKNRVRDLDKFSFLIELAYKLGAEEANILQTDKIVVENRVILKCLYGCASYGKKKTCPPFILTIDEFRAMLKEYSYALILKFPCNAELDEDVMLNITKYEYSSDTPQEIKLKIKRFWRTWNKDKLKVLHAIFELEKAAFNHGYMFSIGFSPGACPLCETCDIEGECRYPTMKRVPVYAVGVNVKKTLRNAGMNINFPCREKPNLVTMLLID